jgi:hypothetical protein
MLRWLVFLLMGPALAADTVSPLLARGHVVMPQPHGGQESSQAGGCFARSGPAAGQARPVLAQPGAGGCH